MSGLQEKFGLTKKLPYGVPDFDNLGDEDYREGLVEAMAAQLAALEELAAQTCGTVKSADTTARREQIEAEMMPQLAAHNDSIYLNRAIFDRFAALDERARAGEVELDEQDAWLLSEILRTFRRAGITLDEAG